MGGGFLMFLVEFPEAKGEWCMRGFVNDSSWSWCRGDRKQWIARCMCCLRMLVSGNPSICTFLWPSHILYSNIRLVMLWDQCDHIACSQKPPVFSWWCCWCEVAKLWIPTYDQAACRKKMCRKRRHCQTGGCHLCKQTGLLDLWWKSAYLAAICCNHMVFHGSNRDGQVFGRTEW